MSTDAQARELAECKRSLRAALVREYIWNDPPLVYDRNGDPAIAIKFVGGEEGGLDALRKNVLSIVQNAECVISEGKWTDKPISIVDRQGRTLGHYTGTALSADTDWTQIIMQRPPTPEVSEDAANIRRQMAERLKQLQEVQAEIEKRIKEQ